MLQRLQLLAERASSLGALLDQRLELSGSSLRAVGVVLLLDPLLSGSLEVVGCVLAFHGLVEQHSDTLLHLLVAQCHTEAKLAEVLEQRVVESRTLTLVVGAVWCRRNRSRVDRRATRSVGDHLAVTKELRDQLDVRSLTAAGASARELKQRLSELRVLRALLDVDEVLLRLHVVGQVSPVLCFLLHVRSIYVERNHLQSLLNLTGFLVLLARADISTVAAA